jgi:hypothetical protein
MRQASASRSTAGVSPLATVEPFADGIGTACASSPAPRRLRWPSLFGHELQAPEADGLVGVETRDVP